MRNLGPREQKILSAMLSSDHELTRSVGLDLQKLAETDPWTAEEMRDILREMIAARAARQ